MLLLLLGHRVRNCRAQDDGIGKGKGKGKEVVTEKRRRGGRKAPSPPPQQEEKIAPSTRRRGAGKEAEEKENVQSVERATPAASKRGKRSTATPKKREKGTPEDVGVGVPSEDASSTDAGGSSSAEAGSRRRGAKSVSAVGQGKDGKRVRGRKRLLSESGSEESEAPPIKVCAASMHRIGETVRSRLTRAPSCVCVCLCVCVWLCSFAVVSHPPQTPKVEMEQELATKASWAKVVQEGSQVSCEVNLPLVPPRLSS